MMTAAKILFTDPPKKKQFGFDFHLVQFFFACLPSLGMRLTFNCIFGGPVCLLRYEENGGGSRAEKEAERRRRSKEKRKGNGTKFL
ncbi:hypothetical protein Fmac_012652 [Flemingia macrophylla]|uniref:Uncharacterized protein n=1 Tax=Flemingia macrophylla TaxID=520843 RepID=A0ABD1MRB8_9FABA